MTIIYYRGPTALITDRTFLAWCPGRQRFAITELYDVHVVRGGADRLALSTTRVAGMSAAVALAALPFVDASTALVVLGVLVLVPGTVSGACWRFNHPEYELRATYHGRLIRLYASRDPQTFGQVRRALLRVLEAHSQV
jgi:hypothetical protein